MLRNLSIRNFVIVDHMDLEFRPGFTVLTGETGAGKSILIDALALTLGERADASIISAGAERTEISAEFDISNAATAHDWLTNNDLAGDPDCCILRRVVDSGARSRGFINGHAATLAQLRELGGFLVDIHGQHSHQSLLRTGVQRELLDAYAGASELVKEVAIKFRAWQSLRERRENLEKNAAAVAAEREHVQWKLKELEALNLVPEEWPSLIADHKRMAHSASLLDATQAGIDALSEGENASLSQINSLHTRFGRLLEYDESLKEVLQLLGSAQTELQECVYSLQRYQQRFDFNPDDLRKLDQRMETIHSAARKYRVTPEQLPIVLQDFRLQLEVLSADASSAELLMQEEAAKEAYTKAAEKVSQIRKKAAKKLSEEITASMQTLAMAGGNFELELRKFSEPGAYGFEQAEFLVAAHASLPPRPLAKVASGGELSRVSLAIQTAMSRQSSVPTLIFDEVDAGIGGKVAEIVGKMLKNLGKEHQVMCITHLPQVASAGDQQWQVAKNTKNGRVSSKVTVLDPDQRIEEIARMLGGVKITETTRSHAREMLG